LQDSETQVELTTVNQTVQHDLPEAVVCNKLCGEQIETQCQST